MKYKILIGLLCSYCVVNTASAHDDYTIEHKALDYENFAPYYVGLGFGFSSADSECDYYGYDCDGEGDSFTFYGGKRLNENFAIEIAYLDLGNIDDEQSATVTTTADTTGVNLSLLGIIPTDHLGYFYGKIGVMAWETDYTRFDGATRTSSDDNGTDITFGIGFAFDYQQKIDFRIEFERLNELDDRLTPGGDHITQLTFSAAFYIQ